MTDPTRSPFAPQPSGPLLPTLLDGLSRDPGRPRITWYGPGGERVELSGHVLDNWVTKSTNLLVEEFEVGPGSTVVLDLPPHWRAVVWAFAVWRAGGCVVPVVRTDDGAAAVTGGAGGGLGVDRAVVVTDRPDAWSTAHDAVAVALPALARRFDGALPAGAMDAASAVMTYGDVLTFLQEHDPGADAVEVEGAVVPHADLEQWAREIAAVRPSQGTGPRLLVRPSARGVFALLGTALDVLARDGSLVLLDPATSRELDGDPARLERLIATERAQLA